jgi:polyisoprenyl-phosphate glycosyltransferase
MSKMVVFVIPACNEQSNVLVIAGAIKSIMAPLDYDYRILFVDDGSTDQTLPVLKSEAATNKHIHFISLSRNFGHQNALKAGLDFADGDCVIMMDADLQHPPDLIPVLLQKWEEGTDIVYTIRKEQTDLSLLKRKTSAIFYDIINNMSDIELEQGTADFRLMDRKVVEAFKQIREHDLFIRGLVKWMGFSQSGVAYYPAARLSGESKYTIKKMVRFALQGITSFSTKPLYMAAYLGFSFAFLSIVAAIAFFGGLQLMILGIIGLYLGKLFMQSKSRPHYLVKETNL